MQEPNQYTITAHYNLSSTMQGEDRDFELGMNWYNYEFSKDSPLEVSAYKFISNRLNLNTKTSLGFKAFIEVFTHLIKQKLDISQQLSSLMVPETPRYRRFL